MKIIIAGAGEVGAHLARMLSIESQDIILIDKDKYHLQHAESHMDVQILRGDATSPSILKKANIARTDLLIAATDSETSNLTIAMLGKKLGAKRTVARISNPEFLDPDAIDMTSLGVDALVSPESLVSDEILALVKRSAAFETIDFEDGKLTVLGVLLGAEGMVVDRTAEDVAREVRDLRFLNVAIRRDDQVIIPRRDTVFRTGDKAYFIAGKGGVEQIYKLTANKPVDIDNIMILGGSRIGVKTARKLSRSYHVKLIERDRDKCYGLCDDLPNVMVVHGDCRDLDLLEEEGVGNMDAFIAVTGNSETNIMSSLMAKEHGVPKTIALVEQAEFINLSMNIGIDTLINKKHVAASQIFRYVRGGDLVNMANLHGMPAEVLEFEVKEGSRIARGPVREQGFPRRAIIGGYVRGDEGHPVFGNTILRAGDRALVFCLPDAVDKVSAFFR
ncbi:MAG: Trk system potassium transporter TrkA [Flavobacteriales bacterium]|nr:Trk system potassium transporter TrkA [Flavobacteriales bacterium]